VLSFLLKLVFVLILGRLIGGLVRLALGRRTNTNPSRKETPQQPKTSRRLGEDIVDAEFEDLKERES
jgi:hypothetical protein